MQNPINEQPKQEQELPQQSTAAAERVLEHLDAAHTRHTSKKAVRAMQEETTLHNSVPRLQFTDEERAAPELQTYIRKSEKAADRLDATKAKIPKQKKLIKERTYEEAAGKGKTRLRFEEREKPAPGGKPHNSPLSRPRRRRAFSSTTGYIRLKRTMRGLRARIKRKNSGSAAHGMGCEKSGRATTAAS